MLIAKSKLQENGSLKMLLPKGWWLNDYSPTENLIEIEDRNEGERFWVEPKALFKRDIRIGKEIFVIENKMVSTAKVERFDATIERKRCYLLAFLNFDNANAVPFDRALHMPQSFGYR